MAIIISIIALFTCFIINQAYPVVPNGFYNYPSPYYMTFYPYAIPPFLHKRNIAPAVPIRPTIGFMQSSYSGFKRNFVKANNDKISNVRKSPQYFDLPEMPDTHEIQIRPNERNQEIRGNALEMEEEYDQKKMRDTEWDQSDYDNDYWENTNDVDEIKDLDFHKKSTQTPIDLRGDTYVNDLLAAKGARINPDSEFVPPKPANMQREQFMIPQLNYYGDTNINNILAARNTAINPDAEFIPPSSIHSAPRHVHYIYEDNNNPAHLTRDIEVNHILLKKGAPVNPDSEMNQFSYNRNNDINSYRGEYFGDTYVNEILKKSGARKNPNAEILIQSKPEQQGQYSADTYVNVLLEEKGTPLNTDAEIFTPVEDVIEFVPLGAEEFEFEHDLTGDTNVNKIAEARGVRKNPLAEEFEVKQQIFSSRN